MVRQVCEEAGVCVGESEMSALYCCRDNGILVALGYSGDKD